MSYNIPAISVKRVSKHYRLWKSPSARLRASIWTLLKRYDDSNSSRFYSKFKALDEITFEVAKGETIGIIGRNGAGKSTLLQTIAGTLNPTSGTMQVNGKVAALLELGAGFNPEFTGRENIVINASILGLTQKEIEERSPSIIKYAEIDDFIDQPVKTYSSGMQMRLAFAVAVHVDADIFIIDEALSVGDAWFQLKCAKTIADLVKSGKTFILVSHSSIAIKQFCDRAILLDRGKILEDGEPNRVCNIYSKLVSGISETEEEESVDTATEMPQLAAAQRDELVTESREQRLERILKKLISTRTKHFNPVSEYPEFEYGQGTGEISRVTITDSTGSQRLAFLPKDKLKITFNATSGTDIDNSIFGLTVKNRQGHEVYISNTRFSGQDAPCFRARQTREVSISAEINLMAGEYFLSIGWVYFAGDDLTVIHRKYDFEKITVLPEDHCAGVANLFATFSFSDPQ